MSVSETYSGLYEFFENDIYTTVEVVQTGEGWVSRFLMSRKFEYGLGEVQLVGYFCLPVWGADREEAVRRVGFISEDIINLTRDIASGDGSIGTNTVIESARTHAKAHLQYWAEAGAVLSKTERTAVMYSLAVDFGINDPAALIAEVEVVGVRTIHERLAYARRIGILDSYGRGRVRKAEPEPDAQIEFESPKSGYRVRRDGVWYDFQSM